MPRPTAAQFAYGSATVVFATAAMLLLAEPRSGPALTAVACAGLALGLLVALTVPAARSAARAGRQRGERAVTGAPADGRRDAAREHAVAGSSRR